ncbi:MAG: DUF1294 domain-containing protein [Bacteroidales bacterium]|nr:DUF1294 domain-containing protein [Bacteroidales bacterium]
MEKYICIVLFVLNIISFICFAVDKYKAKRGKWRISEKTLLLLAICGGSIGAFLGMKTFHHKTKHNKFKFGVPIILFLHILILIFYLTKYFNYNV